MSEGEKFSYNLMGLLVPIRYVCRLLSSCVAGALNLGLLCQSRRSDDSFWSEPPWVREALQIHDYIDGAYWGPIGV